MLWISLPTLLVSLLLAAPSAAQVQFLGVAIAGGDFGCQIDGRCPTGSTQLPLGSGGGGGDGPGQMTHWTTSLPKPLNMFRLPVSWQFLVNNKLGGGLDATNSGKYDQLVRACLATGAHCMIDIHNFARWDGGVIGQGGPTDEQFAGLWAELAGRYAAEDRVVFEIMNEPHDLDLGLWAATCQKVVAAIRGAGAAGQMILLPGTNFDSAASLVSSGSADLLMGVSNPDGSKDNLVLDVHKYLDEDNSGTHSACTTNNIDAFSTVADYLRKAGRKGLVSESGASHDASCMTAFCEQNSFINQNADVFIGLVGWGAGSFDTNYILSLTPSKQGGKYTDNQLMQRCMMDTWTGSGNGTDNSKSQRPTVLITPIVTMTVGPSSAAPVPTATDGETSTLTMSVARSGGLETATGSPTSAATSAASGGDTLQTASGSSPNMTTTASTATSTIPATSGGGTVGAHLRGGLGVVFGIAIMLASLLDKVLW